MKQKIIKLSTMFLFMLMMGAGCDWMYNSPVLYNVDIYKTKGDYRHLYVIRMSGDEISAINCWERDKTLWSGLNQDTIYDRRQYGANGYILGRCNLSDIYLSLTYKEVVLKEIAMNNPGNALPADTLRKYFLDEDPYLECWRCTTELELKDSLRINEIIQNGEIEKYFKRLK